ncbi:hypothetical protein AALO_G00247380 [Alosa alosa]|uniref:Uncharacterized protein n=2 Tax=Alosa alosa TaxID=278164 RepID=A0AAV6FT46_9TELE|nr:hypothetical protein AALO_G00247380 [Alosa alosa]
MWFDKFKRQFSWLEICDMTADALSDDSSFWNTIKFPGTLRLIPKFHGTWRRSSMAGECRNKPRHGDLCSTLDLT